MKFMLTWSIPPASYRAAVERFLSTGAPLPAGVKSLGRWHGVARNGFHLVETDNPGALLQHAAEWKDVLELTVEPVVDDKAAGAAVSAAIKR
jgi:hypothetical protein